MPVLAVANRQVSAIAYHVSNDKYSIAMADCGANATVKIWTARRSSHPQVWSYHEFFAQKGRIVVAMVVALIVAVLSQIKRLPNVDEIPRFCFQVTLMFIKLCIDIGYSVLGAAEDAILDPMLTNSPPTSENNLNIPFRWEEQAWEQPAWTSRLDKIWDDELHRFFYPSPSTPNCVGTDGRPVLSRALAPLVMTDLLRCITTPTKVMLVPPNILTDHFHGPQMAIFGPSAMKCVYPKIIPFNDLVKTNSLPFPTIGAFFVNADGKLYPNEVVQ
ncbi:hypothetical protein BDM02DRAFT_3132666 [Thelephora ganbajun]|uniref:Uncharacterized protein n=1 Tax=Thelephora ganbajun TaxID=370292 RepID=A0ACB6Z092_THEGA|nr:hypothetical protein BDM02DRAFT_3132666 [Thelephora ganbajun]